MPGSEPFIRFQVPANGHDHVVDAILRAHVRHAAARDLRVSWVHLLALLGGLMALAVMAPALCPEWLRANLAVAWGMCGVGALATAIREAVWQRRRDRLLAENARTSALDGPTPAAPPTAIGGTGPCA